MKKILILIISGVVFLGYAAPADGGVIDITDVSLTPETPSISTPITINSSGVIPWDAWLEETVLTIDGYNIELDHHFIITGFMSVTEWSLSDELGFLPAGTYELTLRAMGSTGNLDYSEVYDTYSTSFEVIPEPATLALLCLGGLALLRKRRA